MAARSGKFRFLLFLIVVGGLTLAGMGAFRPTAQTRNDWPRSAKRVSIIFKSVFKAVTKRLMIDLPAAKVS